MIVDRNKDFAKMIESIFTKNHTMINEVKKQVIIVTKSFLKEKNGEAVLDQAKVDEVNGSVFRIEKKKPFDDKKLGTIQTVISKIK